MLQSDQHEALLIGLRLSFTAIDLINQPMLFAGQISAASHTNSFNQEEDALRQRLISTHEYYTCACDQYVMTSTTPALMAAQVDQHRRTHRGRTHDIVKLLRCMGLTRASLKPRALSDTCGRRTLTSSSTLRRWYSVTYRAVGTRGWLA